MMKTGLSLLKGSKHCAKFRKKTTTKQANTSLSNVWESRMFFLKKLILNAASIWLKIINFMFL